MINLDDIYYNEILLNENQLDKVEGVRGGWLEYNRNPLGKKTKDCVIRAISTALGRDYTEVKAILHKTCLDTPNAHHFNDMRVINKVLEKYTSVKQGAVQKGCKRWSVEDLAITYPDGIYIVRTSSHLTCVINGMVIDTWDCRGKTIYEIWTIKGKVPNLQGKRLVRIL